jgi:hypothetical protein
MDPSQNQMRVRWCQLGLSRLVPFEDSYPSIFMRLDGQGDESMTEVEYQPHPALK